MFVLYLFGLTFSLSATKDFASRWLHKRRADGIQGHHLWQHPAVGPGHHQRHGDALHRLWLLLRTGTKAVAPVVMRLQSLAATSSLTFSFFCRRLAGGRPEAAEPIGLHRGRHDARRACRRHPEAVEGLRRAVRLRASR